ncbi:hypothetical protein ILYODFUR_024613 [Ilyodon furcidens]|uniref:Immunoglobulin V-set domain-containing protein n=3 Tax=Goodeidae TaxID=28758 RepID=A0ABU7CHH2_9TELE|nr:hypothetical protein [Ataeniobius toweri]
MKLHHLTICIITLCRIDGVYLSKHQQVFQSPDELLLQSHGEAKLTLTHKIQSYDTILWYQRLPRDTSLKLIGYVSYKNQKIEAPFEGRFKVSGDGENTAHLHILNLTYTEDSGEYFGAASMHSEEDRGFLIQKPTVI